MTAGFAGVIASTDKLGKELDRLQDAQRVERMTKLQEQGDMVTYNVLGTIEASKQFVNARDKLDNLKNKPVVAEVDARVKTLEAALAELKKALQTRSRKPAKRLKTAIPT